MANEKLHGMDCRIYVPAVYAVGARDILGCNQVSCTEYTAYGTWYNAEDDAYREPVIVFSVLTTDHTVIEKVFDQIVRSLQIEGESQVLTQYIPTSFVIQ